MSETVSNDPLPGDLVLETFTDLDAAKPDWLSLEGPAGGTPYQSWRWLKAWSETVGRARHIEPLIACGRLGGRTVVLLPLALERKGGIRTLTFLGHQNGNQNTGCWDADFYRNATAECLERFLRELCTRSSADLLVLENIPETWLGRPHPLVQTQAEVSPSPIFVRTLPDDFETLFRDTHSKSSRKNLLRKQRHLQELEGYRIAKAETADEIRNALEAFFAQRAIREAESGIPNAFGTPVAQDFISRVAGAAAQGETGLPACLDLWFLEAGGSVRATYLCAEQSGTIHAYSNSVAHDELLPNSPGLVLIKEIIAAACARADLNTLDLGLGEERYKTAWAQPQVLRDSLIAVTGKGRFKLALSLAVGRSKSAVRNSERLWPLVRALRKWKAGLGGRRPD